MSSSSAVPAQSLPVLGVDIAKASFDVCLLAGERLWRGRFTNHSKGFAQLFAWLHKAGVTTAIVALEATGAYSEGLAQAAFAAGHRVLVFNPHRVLEYARSTGRRNKTDRVDAELIARYVGSQRPDRLPWWQPLPPAQAHLRDLIRRQADLENTLYAEERRLEVASAAIAPSLKRTIRWLTAELARLEKALHAHLKRSPDLAADIGRLRQIGGCGEKTARLLAAEIPRHFRNARAVAAWLGVVPRIQHSGTSVRKPAHVGHEAPWLRAKLYFPAVTAMRCDPRCQQLAARLHAAGKPTMSIILAVLHKLIRTAFAILKDRTNYDPAHQVSLRVSAQCSP
jgi:transposase